MLQPLIVSYESDDEQGPRYQLIAGERRWQAARMAGLDTVPAMIREATPRQMLEIALVENLQREGPELSSETALRLPDADRRVWADGHSGG